ncbi:hybrid sensor histidine kinase/response regulator [Ramlibacter sp. MAHUQ-53]|uniref:hybrid sensor histidine kinase/response regulator n=1 Tax=unclassified Ramlibacter TaxID=2617605 RepID=UPI00363CDC6C
MNPPAAHGQSWTVRAVLLALVLACLLPGVLGAAALFAWQYRQARTQLAQTTVLTARAMAQAVDHHLLKVLAVGQALSTSAALAAGDLGHFHAEARATIDRVGLGTTVVLRDEAGRQLLNTLVDYGRSLEVAPRPDQVKQVFATGQPVISDLFTGAVLRRPIMSVDVPVFVGGRVRYALSVGVVPSQFNALLREQELPADWVAGIMDRQGVLAGRTRAADRFVGTPASPSVRAHMRERPEGAGEAFTAEGELALLFYSRAPVSGWTVAIGIPRAEADAVFARTSSLIAAGVAAMFALSAVLAWWIGGQIVRCFEALQAAAADLGAGRPPVLPSLPVAEAAQAAQGLGEAALLLERRRQTLQENAQRKDEFIAVLAHELRNPLAPVRTAVEILRRDATADARQRRALEILERQVAHMARLVDDLLDVSRIARGKMALNFQPCDLAAIARQTAEDYRRSVEAAGLRLAVDAGPAPLWVEGDPVRLAQMVGNLLNNATRFTDPGGQVEVRAGEGGAHGEAAEVCVSDTGIGLSAPMLERLFDAFGQADQDLARSKGGLGLGLALTRGLAQLHGGTVLAHSEGEGRGARFTLRLPKGVAPAPDPGPAAGAAPALPGARRILVIEDNEDAAQTLADLLALGGHAVRVAATGEAGIAAAREFRPQVVISDIGLAGALDGYAVARALRAEPALPGLRLVALSGYADARARERSRAAGFDLHLAKPADMATLQRAIEDG